MAEMTGIKDRMQALTRAVGRRSSWQVDGLNLRIKFEISEMFRQKGCGICKNCRNYFASKCMTHCKKQPHYYNFEILKCTNMISFN